MRFVQLMQRCAVTGGVIGAALAAHLAIASAALAAPQANPGAHGTRLVLLGTGAGPIPRRLRSQPSSLLVVNGKPYMIDAGNGVARQLVSAGFEPADVRVIFITHHHIDHNADLGTLMSFIWVEDNERSARAAPPVQIYGPPATGDLAHAALDYLSISERIFSSEIPMIPAAKRFEAHDIAGDGLVYQDENVRVTAAQNTHFHIPPAAAAHGKDKSYSYRFDTADRSVVFTGDTGPSEALAKLAAGADVLVSEVIDLDATEKYMSDRMSIPPQALAPMRFHMEQEHLTAEEIGKMAAKARVRTVVLTHFSPGLDSETDASRYTSGVRKYFPGTVIAGQDLFEY
jgi:ribonuclease BN (tRNA processing enzyme)